VGASTRSLLVVGLAGGLVPSPSALLVLLGGIALGRAWLGVLLVIAYGVGMALALVATGMLLVRARARLERWTSSRRGTAALPLARALPLVTAAVVLVLGLGVAWRGLLAV
ncbi:MAG: nickel transporter, partial [Actinomycetota bacterium]|nr:nickel transporter [Actinomycetota bacterium]